MMPDRDFALTVALSVVVLSAAVLDVRSRRIPNTLVIVGLIVGLLLRAIQGIDALWVGLLGATIGLGVGYALFAIGVFGGGDGKLLMTVGAYFGGPDPIVGALLAIAVAGGGLGILWAVRQGALLPILVTTGRALTYLLTFGRSGSLRTLRSPGAMSVPYGLAIAAGSIIWWFWGVPVL